MAVHEEQSRFGGTNDVRSVAASRESRDAIAANRPPRRRGCQRSALLLDQGPFEPPQRDRQCGGAGQHQIQDVHTQAGLNRATVITPRVVLGA